VSRRAFVVVLDACGAGPAPDSAAYGDAGASTLEHVAREAGGLALPAMGALGLGNVVELEGVPPSPAPGVYGRLHPTGAGKDSASGHRELMGDPVAQAPRRYPGGFPDEVLDRVRRATGHEVICNAPYNGIDAIRDFGAEHVRTGALIVYTSQDSVLQIAAHNDVLAEPGLHRACLKVRRLMDRDHAVGRVIARPFFGEAGSFTRSDGRRDYALAPGRTYLDELRGAGVEVHGVGKVASLFAGHGIDHDHHAPRSAPAILELDRLVAGLEDGFVFANLVDTDQVHGHRHDVAGFARALEVIDAAVAGWVAALRTGDLLILTADHGCDPLAPHTDHTRELVPLLAITGGESASRGAGERPDGAETGGVVGRRHDGPMADVGATVLAWLAGRDAPGLPGASFLAPRD
jgi:phosphopentomutase